MTTGSQPVSARFTAPFLMRSIRPPRPRHHVIRNIRAPGSHGDESAFHQPRASDRGLIINITSISHRNGGLSSNPGTDKCLYSTIKTKITLKIYHRSPHMQQELITKSFMRWISVSQQPSTSTSADDRGLREVFIKSEKTFIPEDELAMLLTDGTFNLGRQYRLSVWLEAATSKDWPFPGIDRNSDSLRRFALVAYDYDLHNHGPNSQPLSLWNYSSDPIETCYSLNVDFRWPSMPVRPILSTDRAQSPPPPPEVPKQNGSLSRAASKFGLTAEPSRTSTFRPLPTDPIPERPSNPRSFMPLCVSTTIERTSTNVQVVTAPSDNMADQPMNTSSNAPDMPEPAISMPISPPEIEAPVELSPHDHPALGSGSDSSSRLHSPSESPSAQLLQDAHLALRVSPSAPDSASTDDPHQRRLRDRKQQVKSYNLKRLCNKQFHEDTPSSDSSARSKRPRKNLGSGVGLVKYYFDHCWIQRDRFRCLPCGNMHMTLKMLLHHLQSLHKNVEFYMKPSSDQAENTSIYIRPLPRLVANLAANNHMALSDPAGLASMTTVSPIEFPTQEPETFIVPDNGLPIYDHITHTALTPGTQHTHTGLDKSWLIHRHQCALNDYTDITGAEKLYILAWSTYSLAHDTTRATVARIWLSFLRDHLRWLIASQDLVHQVMHHASVLTACDVLDMDTHDAALRLVQEAWDAWADKIKNIAKDSETPAAIALAERQARQEAESFNPVASVRSIKSPPVCPLCQSNILVSAWVLKCARVDCGTSYHGRCVKRMGEKGLFSPSWKCGRCREVSATD